MMESIIITLEQPIDQFIDHQSKKRNVSPQQMITELVTLGFDTLLQEHYHCYRQGEISFGRLAQELGVTTWELSHLLEERGWPVYNLPSG